jgi:methionyl-tRNA synthetase
MDNITFEEFKKIELRVAEIVSAEEIPGADKLFKLKINLGAEERELAAGIKGHYQVEELVGKKIAVVANLLPRKIRGVESRGMLLAASNDDRSSLTLLTVDRDIPNGSVIS